MRSRSPRRVLAVFMIVFCELAPKIYAALKPDPVALCSTYIYKLLVFVMTPFSWFTNRRRTDSCGCSA